MSKLKIYHCDEWHNPYTEFYLKSEADKVIADLEESHKTEVKELLCLIRDKENNFNRAFDSEEKEIRHQKYTRCLNNAWFCQKLSKECALVAYTHRGWTIDRHFDNKAELYRKWHRRWLAIAEKFKTNSTAQ